MAKTDVTVELFYSGTWHDITATNDVYTRDPITITRGRPDEVSRIPPSSLSLTLDNRDGTFSPRNPMSPLFGIIGRNTPIRVRILKAKDLFATPVVSGWGTAEQGGAWTIVGSPDYYVSGGEGVHRITADLTSRFTTLAGPWVDSDVSFTFRVPVLASGDWVRAGPVVRYSSTVNHYWYCLAINAGNQHIHAQILTGAIGVVATVDSGIVHTAGSTYRVRCLSAGPSLNMKIWIDGAVEPVPWTVSGSDTSFTSGAIGFRSRTDGLNTNTYPLDVFYDNFNMYINRFHGEVESWPQRWSVEGKDVWAPITCNGILRRLNAPGTTKPALSAPLRYIPGTNPVAYWSLEDVPDSTGGAPTTANTGMMQSVYTTPVNPSRWGEGALAQWLAPSLVTKGLAVLRGTPPTGAAPATSVTVDIIRRGGRDVTATNAFSTFGVDGASNDGTLIWEYRIKMNWNSGTPTIVLERFEFNGIFPTTIATGSAVVALAGWDDAPHHWRLLLADNGANVDVTAYLDGVSIMSGTHNSTTLTRPVFQFRTFESTAIWGHAAMWIDGAPSVVTASAAAFGHAGETAATRITRLCTEEGIAVTVVGSVAEQVGPQQVVPVLESMFDAADADGGILYEPRDYLGLAYRTHASLYNQPSTVALNYAAGSEVAPPLHPVEDGDITANDVTVTRTGGSSARVIQGTGILNVQEPPAGVGRYRKDVELLLATDGQALQQAAWLLHLGTFDSERYPVVNLNLTAMEVAGKTALIAQAASLDVGDRFSITNPPAWLPPDSIEQHAQGFTETIESHQWSIAITATPASPYDVLRLETDVTSNLSRIPAATGSTVLAEALDTTETGVDIISKTVPWIDSATYGAQFPFDIIMIGGERMRVTACGNGATGTITTPSTFSYLAQIQIPAGTWTIRWSVQLAGTVGAPEVNNFGIICEFNAGGATSFVTSVNPGAVGTYPQAPVTFTVPAGGGNLAIKNGGNASTAGAQYTGIVVQPQNFTVTRSINGVVKNHAQSEAVQLFRPPVIAR